MAKSESPKKPTPPKQENMQFMRDRMAMLSERGRDAKRTKALAKVLQKEGNQ